MKKVTAILLTALLMISLAACGASSKASESLSSQADSRYDSALIDEQETAEADDGLYDGSAAYAAADSDVYSNPDAKIIRTAEMTIQTLDFDSAAAMLAALTGQYGGYYESSEVENGSFYSSYNLRYGYYTIRIPKENYTSFWNSVGEVGHLYRAQESSKNVGEVYYDTEARLETLTTKRERLLALLDKADLMEDIISLESALSEVQYEIDLYSSDLRKYDSLIDYSTFTVTLEEVRRVDDTPTVQEGFGAQLLSSLKSGWVGFTDGLESFVLWLARNIITLVIWAVIVFVVIRVILAVRKKRRRPRDPE